MSQVTLLGYDLTNGMAASMSMMLIGEHVDSIWHTSVFVYGREYYFDGGVGISSAPAEQTRFGTPIRRELLGVTQKTKAEFETWISRERVLRFGPFHYNLLQRNCNHFTDEAALFLLGRNIPEDIRGMIPRLLNTSLGRAIRPMLEQMTTAPPGSAQPFSQQAPTSQSQPESRVVANVGLYSPRVGLSDEEKDDVMLALAMLQSNELIHSGTGKNAVKPCDDDGFKSTLACIQALSRALKRIVDNPAESKYRQINRSSNAYVETFAPFEEYGLTDLLRAAGFTESTQQQATGNAANVWLLTDANGSQGVLTDLLSSLQQLQEDMEHLLAASKSSATNLSGSAPTGASPRDSDQKEKIVSEVLQFCAYPPPAGYEPVVVGTIDGQPFYAAIGDDPRDSRSYGRQGKCRVPAALTPAASAPEVHCCSSNGDEVHCSRFKVLCIPNSAKRRELKCDDDVAWVPASLCTRPPSTGCSSAFEPFVAVVENKFVVSRSEKMDGTFHPGFADCSTCCCYVPYGGKVCDVTNGAEILCSRKLIPAETRARAAAMQDCDRETRQCLKLICSPFRSFHELVEWTAPSSSSQEAAMCAALPLRSRQPPSHKSGGHHVQRPKLVVCHDMRGGYHRIQETATFSFGLPSGETERRVAEAYTPEYLHMCDAFIYFSHHRVSLPPKEWVDHCHRNGVPVLATIITEGFEGGQELSKMLSNPRHMAAVIQKLADVQSFFGFDGYFINIESPVDAAHVKRLQMFLKGLRGQIRRLPGVASGRHQATVMWYDSVDTSGDVRYQNALTTRNKPFFEVCDSIFTNYFWNPSSHLPVAKESALMSSHPDAPAGAQSDRSEDVYIGVDVFGRHMYGGGGFNTRKAVEAVAKLELSVALFAPGWTLEAEGHGKRSAYQLAESKLWESLSPFLTSHAVAPLRASSLRGLTTPPYQLVTERDPLLLLYLTTYRSGAHCGSYAINGRASSNFFFSEVASSPAPSSHWCQLSQQELIPAYVQFSTSPGSSEQRDIGSPRRIHAYQYAHQADDGAAGQLKRCLAKFAPAAFTSAPGDVWHGDRSLSVTLPAGTVTPIADFHMDLSALSQRGEGDGAAPPPASVVLIVDVAARFCNKSGSDARTQESLSLCLLSDPSSECDAHGNLSFTILSEWSLVGDAGNQSGCTSKVWPRDDLSSTSDWEVHRCVLPLTSALGTASSIVSGVALRNISSSEDAPVVIGGIAASLALRDVCGDCAISPLVLSTPQELKESWKCSSGVDPTERRIEYHVPSMSAGSMDHLLFAHVANTTEEGVEANGGVVFLGQYGASLFQGVADGLVPTHVVDFSAPSSVQVKQLYCVPRHREVQ